MNEYQREMMRGRSVGAGLPKPSPCSFCGRPAYEDHHVVPRSQGGSDGPTVRVCGRGNADGCHGLLHGHRLHMRNDGGRWLYLLTAEPTKYDRALSMPGWKEMACNRFSRG